MKKKRFSAEQIVAAVKQVELEARCLDDATAARAFQRERGVISLYCYK